MISRNSKFAKLAALAFIAMLGHSKAHAQLDRIYPVEGNVVSGKISGMTPDSVTIQVGGAERTFATGKIKRLFFNREPGPLTNARNLILDEQYTSALNELKPMNIAGLERKEMKAEATFFLALCIGKEALAGRGPKDRAVSNLLSYAGKNRTDWHFWEAAKMIGDLALAQGKYADATRYYGSLAKAQDPDLKFQSKYLVGWSQLKQKKNNEAMGQFDALLAAKVSSPKQLRFQKFAAAGRAAVLAGSKPDEGLKVLTKLLSESDSSDVELFARACNAQGACYAAKSDPEGAVISYLKTHLLFQSDADSHVEALSELVQLWPQIGQPERGNEARAILQKQYPGRN